MTMNFTLYGIDIPLWLLFLLALIGLLTCVLGGAVGAVSIIRLIWRRLARRYNSAGWLADTRAGKNPQLPAAPQ